MVDTRKTAAASQLALTEYLRSIFRNREILFAMAIRDFKSRHVGTLGGFLWNIFQPVATIAVFWMVFSLGFKAKGPSGMPFVLYFMGGLVPWLLFTESFNGGVNAVTNNATLVKKTIFPTGDSRRRAVSFREQHAYRPRACTGGSFDRLRVCARFVGVGRGLLLCGHSLLLGRAVLAAGFLAGFPQGYRTGGRCHCQSLVLAHPDRLGAEHVASEIRIFAGVEPDLLCRRRISGRADSWRLAVAGDGKYLEVLAYHVFPAICWRHRIPATETRFC